MTKLLVVEVFSAEVLGKSDLEQEQKVKDNISVPPVRQNYVGQLVTRQRGSLELVALAPLLGFLACYELV